MNKEIIFLVCWWSRWLHQAPHLSSLPAAIRTFRFIHIFAKAITKCIRDRIYLFIKGTEENWYTEKQPSRVVWGLAQTNRMISCVHLRTENANLRHVAPTYRQVEEISFSLSLSLYPPCNAGRSKKIAPLALPSYSAWCGGWSFKRYHLLSWKLPRRFEKAFDYFYWFPSSKYKVAGYIFQLLPTYLITF